MQYRRCFRIFSAFALFLLFTVFTTVLGQSAIAPQPRLIADYGNLPMRFELNRGQTDRRVKFISRGQGYTLFLTSTEAVLALAMPEAKQPLGDALLKPAVASLGTARTAVVHLELVGANRQAVITPEDELPVKSNYFIGNDSGKWRTNIRNCGRLRYRNIYPGIDLLYYGKARQLEHDFVIAAGGDPNVIAFAVRGTNKLNINKAGDLVMQTSGGRLSLLKPKIYQVLNGVRRDVFGRYILKDADRIGFEIANYDHRQPLVIDPVLNYSTYLGGSQSDWGSGITIDSVGNAYIIGSTTSIDFPTETHYESTPRWNMRW
jgi:hypothetical protein